MKHDDRSSKRSDAALTGNLRWYGAAAAAAGVLAAAPAADAQIVYTDVNPDATLVDSFLNIDFDGDGDPELVIAEQPGLNYIAGFPDGALQGGADQQIGIVGTTSFGYQYFLPLSAGNAISAGNVSTTGAFQFGPTFTYNNADPGNWVGAGDKYAGVQFTLSPQGTTHFGWIRLNIPSPGTVTVKDYAYESAPNTPIIAGAMGQAVTLNGSVNQTTFPASGGTLIYTFTLMNSSGSSLPVRLEVTATRNGNPVLNRTLGSGTLPNGQSVTQSVPLRVPGNAPAGQYEVQYRFVNSSTSQVIASQTFTITKSAAPGVAGNAPLFVATTPGDLFDGATTTATTSAAVQGRLNSPDARTLAAAQAASEAVMSVVGPNPFAGSTALALAVPSAQHVRVAVYDALGREVAVLHDGAVAAGEARRLTLDGSALAAGVYVVRSVGETFTEARTVTVTR